jgi:hypothetical protein
MSFDEQWQWVKPVWRVLLVILVAQLIGMALGLQRNITGQPFFNLWYGAAYATPIGFALGLLWHAKAVPNGLAANRTILLILGAMSVGIPLFGLITYDTWQFAADR